jgi:glycosyltransferase involved in cell wall biosynthesis
MNSKRKLFIVVNVDWFFLSHRLPIAKAAQENGYDVTILTQNTGKFDVIKSEGFGVIDVPFKRSGTNVLNEFKIIYSLKKEFSKIKPDVIHNVALKASIYGSIAAKWAKKGKVINAISGLGFVFTNEKAGLLKKVLISMMKFAFSSSIVHFIFQNPDDFNLFEDKGYASSSNSIIISGSGVDLNEFKYCEPPNGEKIIIVLVARMLEDKGIRDFKEASNILMHEFNNKIKWMLIGPVDNENLSTLSENELHKMSIPGYFEWLGFQENVDELYKKSNIVSLPSYREGLPKSLIEACAIGRPIVTTNAPGCKECVDDGVNGYLVPVGNPLELANKIKLLINDANLRVQFGKNSRLKAENEFSIDGVVQKTINFYSVVCHGNTA